jgi:hypothetical protein
VGELGKFASEAEDFGFEFGLSHGSGGRVVNREIARNYAKVGEGGRWGFWFYIAQGSSWAEAAW